MDTKIKHVKVELEPMTINIRDFDIDVHMEDIIDVKDIKAIEIDQIRIKLNPLDITGLKVIDNTSEK